MVVIKDGIHFQAKIIYSNRFGDRVEVTGGNLCDRIASFDLTEDAEKRLTSAATYAEVDRAILDLYEGKKGRK